MIETIGKYYIALQRPCWANNITNHAVYTQDIPRNKRQKNGAYFLSTQEVLKVGPLTRKEVRAVRLFVSRLRSAKVRS